MKLSPSLSLISFALLGTSTLALPSSHSDIHRREAPARIPKEWIRLSSASPNSTLSFQIYLNSRDENGLDSKMMEIVNEGSGNWLKREDLKSYISSDHEDVVKSYLVKNGVSQDSISTNKLGNILTVKSMKVEDASKMFNTGFSFYSFGGKAGKFIKTESYSLPHEMGAYVIDVSLNNFGTPQRVKSRANVTSVLSESTVNKLSHDSDCDPNGVTPNCLRNLYGTVDYQPSSDDPAIGIMGYGEEYVSQEDLTAFLQRLRPDAKNYTVQIQSINDGTNDPSNPGYESMLDVESVAGLAYPIPITFYSYGHADLAEGGDNYTKTLQYFLDLDDAERPKILSISYGTEENFYTRSQSDSMCKMIKQLASLGTTTFVASGDFGVSENGDESCPPFRTDFISGCPYVVSVGATANTHPEIAPSAFFSSGGFSILRPAPLYQKLAVAGYLLQIGDKDRAYYDPSGRAFPDLSAQGNNSVIVVNGQFTTISGTSASCPEVAAIFGNLNSARKRAGKGPIGWANPTLYLNPFAFNDITQGGAYGCDKDSKLGFPAKPGFDPVTGLGSPKFNALRAAFGA